MPYSRECNTDQDCDPMQYCYQTGFCTECYDCAYRHQVQPIICPRQSSDCGPCLPGFTEDLFQGSTSGQKSCIAPLQIEVSENTNLIPYIGIPAAVCLTLTAGYLIKRFIVKRNNIPKHPDSERGNEIEETNTLMPPALQNKKVISKIAESVKQHFPGRARSHQEIIEDTRQTAVPFVPGREMEIEEQANNVDHIDDINNDNAINNVTNDDNTNNNGNVLNYVNEDPPEIGNNHAIPGSAPTCYSQPTTKQIIINVLSYNAINNSAEANTNTVYHAECTQDRGSSANRDRSLTRIGN